jgi:SPP1 family predicted phage head-tail adaptor
MAIPGGAGRLRHRVAIWRDVPGTDAGGNAILTPTLVETVWAAVEPASGSEAPAASADDPNRALRSTRSYQVLMRWRSDLTVQHRLITGGKTLHIRAIIDPDLRHEWLEIAAEETPSVN